MLRRVRTIRKRALGDTLHHLAVRQLGSAMEKLDSLLVIMDVHDPARLALARGILLARHFGARLELFLCDTQTAYELGHAYDGSEASNAREVNLETSQRYLESTRRSMADDVAVTIHAACESPLCEAVAHRVLSIAPDLVIKAAGRRGQTPGLDGDDWQVARTCPAPLLLTHGRPWQVRPLFAVFNGSAAATSGKVEAAAAFLARGVDAQLNALEAGHPVGGEVDLLIVASEPPPRIGSMIYRPLDARLLGAQDCDILLIDPSAPARRPAPSAPVGRSNGRPSSP